MKETTFAVIWFVFVGLLICGSFAFSAWVIVQLMQHFGVI